MLSQLKTTHRFWVIIVFFTLILLTALIVSQLKSSRLIVSGILEGDEARIGSRVGGRVLRVVAKEGSQVNAGDVLVEIEPFDLYDRQSEAKAQLGAAKADLDLLTAGFRKEEVEGAKAKRDQAKAELNLAEQNHGRQVMLRKNNTISQQGLDEAQRNLEAARSSFEAAEQELLRLSRGYRPEEVSKAEALVEAAQARLNAIAKQIDELTVKAPISGVVEAINLVPGDLLAPNAPVLSILDMNSLWLRVYVPENKLSFPLGHRVQVVFDSHPNQVFLGHVAFISSQVEFTPSNAQTADDRAKQVYRTKIVLDNGSPQLRPGLYADVNFG